MYSRQQYEMLARKVELFNGLSAEDIAKILKRGMTQRVPKGETIFFKGTSGNTMYVILGGSVLIQDKGKVLAQLTQGDMFGEMALISSEPRSATAVAGEECSLFVLSETLFQKLMTKRVAITMLLNIIKTISHRLIAADKKLVRE